MTESEKVVAVAATAGLTLTRAQADAVAAALAGLPTAQRHAATLAFEDEPATFLRAQREGRK